VPITYLGVWDTVVALGSRFEASDASTSGPSGTFYAGATPSVGVQQARQALAIDEARYDFRPEIWTEAGPAQTMEQRWFAGVHSNVGGGYRRDGLANLALRWILDGARALGLNIDEDFVQYYPGNPKGTLYDSASLLYRVLDKLRKAENRGRRALTGHPPTANLSIDKSVFDRLCYSAQELKVGIDKSVTAKVYRPDNLLRFLAAQPDLVAYVTSVGVTTPLPEDVQRRIEQLRRTSS